MSWSYSCWSAGLVAPLDAQVRCNNPVGTGINDTNGTEEAVALSCMCAFIS